MQGSPASPETIHTLCRPPGGLVPGWHECPFFDERERAAFAWAESLTHVSQTHAPDEAFEGLRRHFNEQEAVDLTFIIAVMNALNRVAVASRKMPAAFEEGIARAERVV